MKTHGFVSMSQSSVCVVILYPAAFTFYPCFTETISENSGVHERRVTVTGFEMAPS